VTKLSIPILPPPLRARNVLGYYAISAVLGLMIVGTICWTLAIAL